MKRTWAWSQRKQLPKGSNIATEKITPVLTEDDYTESRYVISDIFALYNSNRTVNIKKAERVSKVAAK
jgi:hypothetical protein